MEDKARECLRLLSGRTHKVFTGISLIGAKSRQRMVESRLRLAWLNRKVIDAYLASGEWGVARPAVMPFRGRAGAFVVRLFDSYSGCDRACAD